jgi:hypothetical protein
MESGYLYPLSHYCAVPRLRIILGLSDVVTLGFRWSRGFVSPFTFVKLCVCMCACVHEWLHCFWTKERIYNIVAAPLVLPVNPHNTSSKHPTCHWASIGSSPLKSPSLDAVLGISCLRSWLVDTMKFELGRMNVDWRLRQDCGMHVVIFRRTLRT